MFIRTKISGDFSTKCMNEMYSYVKKIYKVILIQSLVCQFVNNY